MKRNKKMTQLTSDLQVLVMRHGLDMVIAGLADACHVRARNAKDNGLSVREFVWTKRAVILVELANNEDVFDPKSLDTKGT